MAEPLVVTIDATVLNHMNFCPENWNLSCVGHWRPNKKAMALERGSLMHKMLDHYYTERMRPGRQDTKFIAGLVEECIMKGRIESVKSEHITPEEFQEDIRVFKEYVAKWVNDGWIILGVEQPFTKTLYESEKLIIEWDGIFDILIIDPKLGKCVVDTKTESRRSDPFILSNQFQGYEWAFGCPVIVNKIGYQATVKKEKLDRNGNQIDERFRRIVHQSGEAAIREWREDTILQVVESIGWMQKLQQGKRLRKDRTSCDKYGGCIYQKVCKEPPEVRDHILAVNFHRDTPWDVYTRDAVVENEETHA